MIQNKPLKVAVLPILLIYGTSTEYMSMVMHLSELQIVRI